MAGKNKKQVKYYPFLDVVVDVFFSIIFYNAFMAFPGWKLETVLMVFSIIIMMNYWWVTRTGHEIPKHYLFDVYFIIIPMFIFAQWPTYYTDISMFTYILAAFFGIDAIYALISIWAHKEKNDEPALVFYLKYEMALAVSYFIIAGVITELNWISLLFVLLPYLFFTFVSFKKGYATTKFIDNDNQPY